MNITEYKINYKNIFKTQVFWRFLLALLLYPVTYILSSNGLLKIEFLSNFLYSISTVIVIYSLYLIYFQFKYKNLLLICGSNNKNFIEVLFSLFISIYTFYSLTLIFAVLYYFFKINGDVSITIFMIFIFGMLLLSAFKFDNLNNALKKIYKINEEYKLENLINYILAKDLNDLENNLEEFVYKYLLYSSDNFEINFKDDIFNFKSNSLSLLKVKNYCNFSNKYFKELNDSDINIIKIMIY